MQSHERQGNREDTVTERRDTLSRPEESKISDAKRVERPLSLRRISHSNRSSHRWENRELDVTRMQTSIGDKSSEQRHPGSRGHLKLQRFLRIRRGVRAGSRVREVT